jgi:hypothetical protein
MTDLPSIPMSTLDSLIQEGTTAWDEFRESEKDRYHLFIPCDHMGAYEALRELRPRASTFVELGSAAGIVTIMADLLGFEAHGIEMEPALVQRSTEIAVQFGSGAVFAEGTFVPPDYQDETEHLSGDFLTPTDGAYAFEELGFGFSDCDLFFAYPWPGDEVWLGELIRRHARPDAILLTYDVCEGFQVTSPAGICPTSP